MWNFGPELSVGIDLGSESVKIVSLEKSRRGLKLLSYGHFDKNDLAGIQNAFTQSVIKEADCRVSMPDSIIKTRKLELPPAPKSDLEQMVNMALSQHLSSPIENYIIRYEEGQKTAYISERSKVENYLAEISKLGVPKPSILEPKSNALALTALHNYELKPLECCAVIDIGHSAAVFAVISADGLVFSRHLSESGGTDLLSHIADCTGISLEEVEERKRLEPDFLTLQCKDSKNEIIEWLYKVAIEIQNSVENFHIQFPTQKVTKLLMTGGASNVNGLSAYIQDSLKIPTSRLKAFSRLNVHGFEDITFEADEQYYAIAVGLAL